MRCLILCAADCVSQAVVSLDLYLAYLRAAFHTCYYCAVITDHLEELQRKCIKHERKPLITTPLAETKSAENENPEKDKKVDEIEKDGAEQEKESKERDGKEKKEEKRNGNSFLSVLRYSITLTRNERRWTLVGVVGFKDCTAHQPRWCRSS